MGWVESPVLTTITTTAKDVTELDFPTITICREVESVAFWSLGWEGGVVGHLPHVSTIQSLSKL